MAVTPAYRGPAGEELDVEEVKNEFEEFRKKAAVGGFPLNPEAGPVELGFKLRERITFPFVPEVFEPEPQGGAELMEEEKSSGVWRDRNETSPGPQDARDFGECPVVAIDIFQVIETEHEVKRPIPARQVFSPELG